ncbi:MAG TPA: hypothetical protein VGI79_20460 [Caulobacteraceae bacterium]
MIAKSSFSFVGTVLHLGAATTTDVPIDDHTAVVHVDHVLHAPEAFSQFEGQQVTLQLSRDVDLPTVGQAFAFFVEGLSFGESVAVAEVGRLPVETVEPHATAAMEAGATAGAFNGLIGEMQHDELRSHMQQADAVVLGKVVGIEKVGPSAHSEHDPDWWRATLEVHHVERGDLQAGKVQVLFANSTDVRWRRAPKARASQSGVWVLHRTEGDLRDLAPFQILDPKDVQPTQQLDTIR